MLTQITLRMTEGVKYDKTKRENGETRSVVKAQITICPFNEHR